MNPYHIQHTAIAIWGLGDTGMAALSWCLHWGGRVIACDTRVSPPNLVKAQQLLGVESVFYGDAVNESTLRGITHVVLSPGISPHDQTIASLLKGREILTELMLFQDAVAVLYQQMPKIIAVTGTNGKTTVTRLCGLLLEAAGVDVCVAGNISPNMLEVLLQRLLCLPAVWVLELSSYQLHGIQHFDPHAATVLNVTEDHLDWHKSFNEYCEDKFRVFAKNTLMIASRDDQKLQHHYREPLRSFGLSAPQHVHDLGVQIFHEVPWIVRAQAIEVEKNNQSKGFVTCEIQKLIPCDALAMRGQHNILNAQAALLLALSLNVSLAPVLHALVQYPGEPYRMQYVANINGVEYINDSKGTNVGATQAALKGVVTQCVLILGGQGKGQDFSVLFDDIKQYCRALVLIGRDAKIIATQLQCTRAEMHFALTLQEAIDQAMLLAKPQDQVLLSPACASLDMFKNYEERGEVFTQYVKSKAVVHAFNAEQTTPVSLHNSPREVVDV